MSDRSARMNGLYNLPVMPSLTRPADVPDDVLFRIAQLALHSGASTDQLVEIYRRGVQDGQAWSSSAPKEE